MSSAQSSQAPVLAAGAVCWRLVAGVAKILVVHRDSRADVSLPKGKVDPGEMLPQTAVREIAEETGLAITLGAPLGTVEYTLPGGREKVVYYWAAEVDDHALELAKFTPNDEIASLEWLPIEKVRKKLTYPHDIEVIDRFAELLITGRARTFAVIAVRHGKAVPPQTWDGPDSTRPLMHRGSDQAELIAGSIAAFGPTKILASTAARCRATVEPLARLTGLEVKAVEGISQDSFEHGRDTVSTIVRKRLKKQTSVVLCSHGPVLPQIIGEVAQQTESTVDAALRRAVSLGTGDFTVLHVSRDHPLSGIVATETHCPD
ncbi:MAG: NUDIX domain-containing protein [Rhodoglobus sp.]|nr:NUDIX domain-containing protein [Rhodoglobus sp.]